jgi:hypothetical protein
MESQNLTTHTPDSLKLSGIKFQHQYLQDLSLIHEKFVDLWFKHINYFEANSGQLPAENLRFIDGLNFVECCYLQKEMDLMADVVALYDGRGANKPRDFYTVVFDMKAQVSAYMNYIDQRITTLHRLLGLMEENKVLADFYVFFGEAAHG